VSLTPEAILGFFLVAYSIILHEIAHGYAALKFGDHTAERMDRLTLHPVAHIDLMGTIIFPAIQLLMPPHRVYLGWAKPVPVNTRNLEPRVAGEIIVSIAGVAVNFAIAFALALLLRLRNLFPFDSWVTQALIGAMAANVGLGIFNLVPIPPLDGSHVAKYFLPPGLREQYEQIGFYGTLILLLLISQRALDSIIGPPIQFLVLFLWQHVAGRG
jgi:Zn-dependent protease